MKHQSTACLRNVFVLSIVFVFVLGIGKASDAQPNQIRGRIVLVVPSGAQPPKEYESRLRAVAKRTETFFAKWMKHWKYPLERQQFFTRDSDGQIQIVLVKASLQGKIHGNSNGELKNLAIKHARARLKLGKKQAAVWWVFYHYPQVKGFHGGGNAHGGKAVNAYPAGTQKISKNVPLAASSVNQTKIKGMIHEFGHALGLPHNGPLKGLDQGNSLMGPTTPNYRKKSKSKDERVYLNESSAALIWKHPLFRNEGPRRAQKPTRFDLRNLKCWEDKKGIIHIEGKLDSDRKAHSAVVFDSDSGNYGTYWIRSHASRLDSSGNFKLAFWSPYDGGRMFLQFCFDDGFNTADGKGQKSQIKIPYSGKPGKRKFSLPENR